MEELKKQEKSLKLKLKDASRQASYRSNRRTIPSYLNSANSARRCEPVERSESLLFQPVLSCNSPTIPRFKLWKQNILLHLNGKFVFFFRFFFRSQKFQNLRKAQNRFLSSSSSESETVKSSKGKSREKITESIGQGKSLGSKSSQKSRGASTERSRHSSEDRKEKLPSQQSSKNLAKRNDSREGKNN